MTDRHPHHDLATKYAELTLDMLHDCESASINNPQELAAYNEIIADCEKMRIKLLNFKNNPLPISQEVKQLK